MPRNIPGYVIVSMLNQPQRRDTTETQKHQVFIKIKVAACNNHCYVLCIGTLFFLLSSVFVKEQQCLVAERSVRVMTHERGGAEHEVLQPRATHAD